jgi:hypothetical protein
MDKEFPLVLHGPGIYTFVTPCTTLSLIVYMVTTQAILFTNGEPAMPFTVNLFILVAVHAVEATDGRLGHRTIHLRYA